MSGPRHPEIPEEGVIAAAQPGEERNVLSHQRLIALEDAFDFPGIAVVRNSQFLSQTRPVVGMTCVEVAEEWGLALVRHIGNERQRRKAVHAHLQERLPGAIDPPVEGVLHRG